VAREEHGPAHDGDVEHGRLGHELEGAEEAEEREDVQEALVVGHIHHRRVAIRQVLQPLDFDGVPAPAAAL
jgi:hypothetical protein